MWYKYEVHMHSNMCSKCGRNTPAEMIKAYHDAGYAGAVITDHFHLGNTCVPRDLPWREQIQRYWDAYLSGREAADELGFDFIFGIEHGYGNLREILIYNASYEFLMDNDDIPSIPVTEPARRVHEAGGFISHAHPYRFKYREGVEYCEADLSICDAIEIFNFSDVPESNADAAATAKRLGMRETSGGDSHRIDYKGIGMAGMAFPHRIGSAPELAQALFAGEGRPIINGEIKMEN